MAGKIALGFVLVFIFAGLMGAFAQTCSDSDGGSDYYIKGTITWNGNSATDTCIDSQKLLENYCKDNVSLNESYACPEGCKEGACLKGACTDSDGGIYPDKQGSVTANGKNYPDTCQDSKYLKEYYCLNGQAAELIKDCSLGYVCKEGACVESAEARACTDTDGEDYYVRGSVTWTNNNITGSSGDYCSGSDMIEYYCFENSLKQTRYSCPNGCQDGACLKSQVCPARIDIEFSRDVYYIGETGSLTVKITDSQGSPIPNRIFHVDGVINGNPTGKATYYTDSRGIYESSGVVSKAGRYEYKVYTEDAGCVSVSDTVSIEVRSRCGDGYCSSDETPDTCSQDCGVCREGESKNCGSSIGACKPGWMYCKGGKWGPCEGSIGPAPEICGNGMDDDCDSLVDEDCACPSKIDISFDKSLYYVGETGTLKVVVYDSKGNPMPNQVFKATGYVNGKPIGYETTWSTGPTGVYTSTGTVTGSLLGTVRYDVWVNTTACGYISDSETITVKESPVKISISSVWSDKPYYAPGEGIKILAKVVDTDGTPAEPGEGTKVSFSLQSPSGAYLDIVYVMEYNTATGYYEKTISAPGEGAWRVFVTAVKGADTARNSDYYFKVAPETRFISVSIDSPTEGETILGTAVVKASAKSSSELTGMTLAITSGNGTMEFPLTNCQVTSTKCATGEKCYPPVYYMTCQYEWDITGYEGKVGLTVTATNKDGNSASNSITVYTTGVLGFIHVNIESPRDGETVSGTQIVRATAKSSAEFTGMSIVIRSENTGVAFPLTNCERGASVCPTGETCVRVYSMTCKYEWDTTYYNGKKVSITVTANNIENQGAGHSITVYVGGIISGWTEEEVRKAFESLPFARQHGLVITPKKGYEILNGINPVVETPARKIVEDWKKYWVLSSREANLYYIILEDASGPSPTQGEYLVYFNSRLLEGQTLPEGIVPLKKAAEFLTEGLNLGKFSMEEAGLILLNFGGMVGPAESVEIAQIVPTTTSASAAGIGGTGMMTGAAITSETPTTPSGGGGGGGIAKLPAYWAMKGTGIKQDGSVTKLEVLMDARTGQILVGPVPGIEEIIRKFFEPLLSKLGLKIAQIRQISEDELRMLTNEMRGICEGIEPTDTGGIYWFVSDTEGVLKVVFRQGKNIQPVLVKQETTPTSPEIRERIAEAEKALVATEAAPSVTTTQTQAVPITGTVVATRLVASGTTTPITGASVGGGGGSEVPQPVTPVEPEITPVLFIYDVNKMNGLPLDPEVRKAVDEVIDKANERIGGDLGVTDLKLDEFYMVMMQRSSYCPGCPEGRVCEPCTPSSTQQFVYAKGITSEREPLKFAYILNYPGYNILCREITKADRNGLHASLWISRHVAAPGDSVIISARVMDYLGRRPVPNAKVVLTMGTFERPYTCPACEIPAEVKTEIEEGREATGIGGGYACKPCVYEEEVIQTIVGETDSSGEWTHLLKIANIKTGQYRLELRAEKSGYTPGYDKKMLIVNNIGPVENRTFEPIDLVRIVLRLETMKIDILKLKPAAQAIANYYSSVGETEKAEAWQGIVNEIDTISSHIEDIKKLIKDLVKDPSEEKLTAIKGEIVKIKKEIDDLLMKIIEVA